MLSDKITALYVRMAGYDPYALNSRINYLMEFALVKGFRNPMFFIDIDSDPNSPYLPEALKIVSGIMAEKIIAVISLADYSCGDADPFENYSCDYVGGVTFIPLAYHTDNDIQTDEIYDLCGTQNRKREVQNF